MRFSTLALAALATLSGAASIDSGIDSAIHSTIDTDANADLGTLSAVDAGIESGIVAELEAKMTAQMQSSAAAEDFNINTDEWGTYVHMEDDGKFSIHKYRLHTGKKNFHYAEKYCRDRGAHLVSIENY